MHIFFMSILRVLGHCVEFNRFGGVIQNQMSSPCNDTFPKCDVVYKSTAAYKCNTTVRILYNINFVQWLIYYGCMGNIHIYIFRFYIQENCSCRLFQCTFKCHVHLSRFETLIIIKSFNDKL